MGLDERLRHYFATYKLRPGRPDEVVVGMPYGRAHAEAVVTASLEDYRALVAEGDAPGP